MAKDWRKTLYQASILLGVVGIGIAFIIFSMINGAIDTLGNAAYAVINSTNNTVTDIEGTVDGAESVVNSTDQSITSVRSSLAPLSDALSAAGSSLGGVASFISQLPGGNYITGDLNDASWELENSSDRIAESKQTLEGTNFAEVRAGISGVRAQISGARQSLADAKSALERAIGAIKLSVLLFFLMSASMFGMQILNAYAGLKSL